MTRWGTRSSGFLSNAAAIATLATAVVVGVSGCASAPAPTPAAPPAAPAAKAAAPVAPTPPAKPAAPAAASADAKDSMTLEQAMAAGYEIVDRNGQRLYCRDELKTGSHLRKTRTCLTAEELRELKENAQREVRGVQIPQPTRGS
jgi:hypothetical protein